jgi:murein L,D-transpeptidase YcbB/YkuD
MIIDKKAFLLLIVIFQALLLKAQENNTMFNWSSSQKQVNILDSLIAQSKYYGLNQSDYRHTSNKAITDTANTNLSINKAAVHFFSELAYGNRLPSIGYYGVQFKLDKDTVMHQVIKYAQKGKLIDLVNYYNNQSKELQLLLVELKKLQDSIPKPNRAIQIVNKAINDYRWLHTAQKNNKIILVNLPSAKLRVSENGKTVMNMKVIVGKAATPSGTLTAAVNQLVVNPYWNVPRSIMVREMLPSIKNDIAYLDRNHLEVRDLNYKKLNPYKINWYDVDTTNFPFYIRQSTGCDNSLGIIKLDFDNPYGIYLHDTPQTELFALNNRYFSHGCMRMEKPIEMAKYLLKNNKAALDSIDFENCYKNPKPINIQMTEKVNVIVWYHLIDFDEKLKLIYYRNIYNKPL